MATIFLSYRRTDGAQAARVHEWLTARFGNDAVFMDVRRIPFAVDFPQFLQKAIESSRILLALIGPGWADRLGDSDDPVRRELEWAVASEIPILPVLIDSARMPSPEELPASLAQISSQNAMSLNVLQGFHAHMQQLLTELERITGMLAQTTIATDSPWVIPAVCQGIIDYLEQAFLESGLDAEIEIPEFRLHAIHEMNHSLPSLGVTLVLHRTSRVAEALELHFLLSFWGSGPSLQGLVAGWALHFLERNPIVPEDAFGPNGPEGCEVRIRLSDEDPRTVWQMIAVERAFCLSQCYVATVMPIVDSGAAVTGDDGAGAGDRGRT